jgi:hypothetical protein
MRIYQLLVQNALRESWYLRMLVRFGARTPRLRENLKSLLFSASASVPARWGALDLLAEGYPTECGVANFISETAVGDDSELNWNALYILASNFHMSYSGSLKKLEDVAVNHEKPFNREYALRILLQHKLKAGSVEQQILSKNLNGWPPFIDLSKPVSSQWIRHCAIELKEDEVTMRLRFTRLMSILPISVEV